MILTTLKVCDTIKGIESLVEKFKFLVYVTKYNKRDILSTFKNIEIFALSIRRSYKLANDTKFIKMELILLKIQAL